jgi:hypothetical protein
MTMPPPERTGRGGGQAADPWARLATQTGPVQDTAAMRRGELVRRAVVVRLRTLTDALSMVFVVSGLGLGTTAAWVAGGRVPGMATLGGSLLVLGAALAVGD